MCFEGASRASVPPKRDARTYLHKKHIFSKDHVHIGVFTPCTAATVGSTTSQGASRIAAMANAAVVGDRCSQRDADGDAGLHRIVLDA